MAPPRTAVVIKIGNICRALIKAYGPVGFKRWIWNREFTQARRELLHISTGRDVRSYIEENVHGENILDLGCGLGGLSRDLDPKKYKEYMGVDISDISIEQARQQSAYQANGPQVNFCQSDINTFVPLRHYRVIVFRDSVYYFPRGKMLEVLRRYRQYLAKDGIFIVRMLHGNQRYKGIAEVIEANFELVAKYVFSEPDEIILLFR